MTTLDAIAGILNPVAAALTRLAEQRDAALALHTPDAANYGDLASGPFCSGCDAPYPCPTAHALGVDEPWRKGRPQPPWLVPGARVRILRCGGLMHNGDPVGIFARIDEGGYGNVDKVGAPFSFCGYAKVLQPAGRP